MPRTVLLITVTCLIIALFGCEKGAESPPSPAVDMDEATETTGTLDAPDPSGAAVKTVKAGCGMCIFKMEGVQGCKLAVEVDGKHYLVKGAPVDAHSTGLCGAEKSAKVAGKVEGDEFVATSFVLGE